MIEEKITDALSDNVPQLLAQIRQRMLEMLPKGWAELYNVMYVRIPNPLDPIALLPIMTGKVVEKSEHTLIDVAAITMLANVSLRIADDCADNDDSNGIHESVGIGKAVHYAMAIHTAAITAITQLKQPSDTLLSLYLGQYLKVCQGQDIDLSKQMDTLEEYKELVMLKTIAAYEFAALAGVYSTETAVSVREQIRQCGAHLGWISQIINDIADLWFPEIDLQREVEKKSFPVLVGLESEHPKSEELKQLYETQDYDRKRICLLLDEMEVRPRLINLALDHRDEAFRIIRGIDTESAQILQMWMDWFLEDARELMTAPPKG